MHLHIQNFYVDKRNRKRDRSSATSYILTTETRKHGACSNCLAKLLKIFKHFKIIRSLPMPCHFPNFCVMIIVQSTDSTWVTMAIGTGVTVAKQCGHKVWHHQMITLLSSKNPGSFSCCHTPKMCRSLNRKLQEFQARSVKVPQGGSAKGGLMQALSAGQCKYKEARWRRR